jgi:hypothetical protein
MFLMVIFKNYLFEMPKFKEITRRGKKYKS